MERSPSLKTSTAICGICCTEVEEAGRVSFRLCVLDRVQQAEGENGQHDEADDGIKPIFFEGETDDRERDTGDRRGDEQQEAKLNEAFALELCGGLDDTAQRLEAHVAGRELAIADRVGVVTDKIERAAREDGCSGEQNADAEQVADDGFKPLIIHY
jgi:hypothetical protein